MEEKTLRIELARENPYGVYYYAELAFPAKEYELQDAREKLRSVGLPDSALFISTLDCPALPELIDVRLDSPTLSELNFFANRLAMLDDEQRVVLTAVAQGLIRPEEDEPISMKDLINLTYGLDGVPVASNISTDEQLGQLVIESDMNEDVAAIPEQALYLLDKRQIGKLQRESDGGVFVGSRYVVTGAYEWPEVYDGAHLSEAPPSEQYAFRLLVSETPESEAEWISLPMSEEEIREFEAAHQRELPYFHCHDLESIVPQITSENFRHMGRFATLNDLAKEIQKFSPDELVTFKAALSAEKPQTLNGVWDVASHVSEYELAAMPGDANDFFKDYLKHHLVAGFDRRWLKNLDAVEMRKGLLDRLGAVETDYLSEELRLTEFLFPPPEAHELKEIRTRITEDYDVRRAAMFLKLLRYSYSSGGKSYASQPFDIRKLFGLILDLQERMANVVVENQDFETLILHYDRPDAFFYADPPYFSTEDMYTVGFGWDDHVRLRDTLRGIKGKFLLSYNDCPEIRGLYEGFSLFDFSRAHSMAQRYEAGKEFKELLIGNYDLYEREKAKPRQMTLDLFGDGDIGYEKILKESIIQCKIRD